MAESDFQTELNRGFAFYNGATPEEGGFGYKIPDVPRAIGNQARFVPQKPFDCFWAPPLNRAPLFLRLPWCVFLELKQKHGMSLNVRYDKEKEGDLRTHQQDALLALAVSGHPAAVLVNFQTKLSAKEAKARGLRAGDVLDVAYAASIVDVIEARTKEATDNLPLEWWERAGIALPLFNCNGKRAWDPAPLLEL